MSGDALPNAVVEVAAANPVLCKRLRPTRSCPFRERPFARLKIAFVVEPAAFEGCKAIPDMRERANLCVVIWSIVLPCYPWC